MSDGTRIQAPVVVNAAGPHSFVINRMAGIEDKMQIRTRALRHEVHFVPSPDEFIYEKDDMGVSDGDLAGYHRLETGNLILVGSEDPACENGHNHGKRPVEVKLKNIDYTLNTKTFSRNREINKNSTFSVLG